jgi:hypothetical protein
MITIKKYNLDFYEVKDWDRNELVVQYNEENAIETAHLRILETKKRKEKSIKVPFIGLWLVW